MACNDLDPAADACVRRLRRNGGAAMAVPGDVAYEGQVTSCVRAVLDAWGRIDILVNNAALLGGRGLLEESVERFRRDIDVAAAGN